MKALEYATIATLISAPLAGADQSDYTSFIRQHQQSTGVVWDMPVELVGESLSPMVVEMGGSLFQLWAIRTSDYRDFLIDQKLVGAYLPSAEITVITEDPYPGVPRTRADRPFDVEVMVHGLLSGPSLPDASKKVLFEQYAAHYPESQNLTRAEALAGDPIRTTYIDRNGKTKFRFPSTSLTGADPTVAVVVRLVRALDRDADVVGLVLASAWSAWPRSCREVQAGDLLVELLRQDVDARGVFLEVLPTGRSAPAPGW
jgi:hypothetical protein